MSKKKVSVVYHPASLPDGMFLPTMGKFETIEQAEFYIEVVLKKYDAKGVKAGLYGINAPEKMMAKHARQDKAKSKK